MSQPCIILSGPTASGKTELSLQLAQYLPIEIVNADMGQLYTPLSIGTAKPRWKESSVKHHLFDVLSIPEYCSVARYVAWVNEVVDDISGRKKIPLIVGGSGFYIESILFPPVITSSSFEVVRHQLPTDKLWDHLYQVDPERAEKIHKNDTYRLQRALQLWQTTGCKPSSLKRQLNKLLSAEVIIINPERATLYQRINERTHMMLNNGWIDEVKVLQNTTWKSFLIEKNIIGYPEIFNYLEHKIYTDDTLVSLKNLIAQKTRNYAKKQISFFKRLAYHINDIQKTEPSHSSRINLTLFSHDLYINQLSLQLLKKFEKVSS